MVKAKTEKAEKIEHSLIPEHKILSNEEAEEILKKYNISKKQLPKILKKDPAIKYLDPKKGEIIEIIRESPTSGKTFFYRKVV